ncbi:MAG: hypothetical protein SGI87_12645 [Flavobacteriales bacterium]|nr:hypothetical protein [Flavobacteriales bacterium]
MKEEKLNSNIGLYIFQSNEEAETYFTNQIIRQDPVDRLRETVELILRVYGFNREELNQRIQNNSITIRYYE